MVTIPPHVRARRPDGPVLLAGGGTVGHLAPGFALEEALRARGVAARFATPGGVEEKDWFPERTESPLRIPAPRRPAYLAGAPAFGARLGAAVARAMGVLRRERPSAVVALGGWPCVPAALAAAASRTPLFFVATDRLPGLVVRRLQGLARRVYVTADSAAEALGRDPRVLVTGPILRAAMSAPVRDPRRFGLAEDRLTLFVTGGSLGARGLNDRVVAGLVAAVHHDPSLARRIQVLHSVGRSDGGAAAAYAAAGYRHHVAPFLREMDAAWGTADLAVTRAGAMTCAEVEATGTPAVLVPYPHHADRQQYLNAAPLVERGAAVLVEEAELDPDRFLRDVVALLLDPARRAGMRRRALAGFRDGSGEIADDLVRFLRGYGRSGREVS